MGSSPYAAVNERRRKRAWNRRSTGQTNRRLREDPERAQREQARRDNKAWLRANADSILADARAKVAAEAVISDSSSARVPLARERFAVTNDRSYTAPQEFDDRAMADDYARTLNDRHPDAHARVVPVRASYRARAHPRRLP
jgi:hypothetical protein